MKKLLALALALCMMVGAVSAMAEGFTPAASYDPGARNFNGGAVTLEKAPAGGGTVTSDVYAGIEGKDYLVQDGDIMHFLFNV